MNTLIAFVVAALILFSAAFVFGGKFLTWYILQGLIG